MAELKRIMIEEALRELEHYNDEDNSPQNWIPGYTIVDTPKIENAEVVNLAIVKTEKESTWTCSYSLANMPITVNPVILDLTLTDVKKEVKIEANIETEMETGIETNVETGIETKVKTGIETMVETGIERKVETGFETNVETKIETKVEAKVETNDSTANITCETIPNDTKDDKMFYMHLFFPKETKPIVDSFITTSTESRASKFKERKWKSF